MATTGGPIEVSITTSSSGEEITRFTDLNTGAVTETRRQQNLSNGPIEVEIFSRPNGEEITRFTDSQGISTVQITNDQNTITPSPNQEGPDPRLAGAEAAVITAQQAAASISPSQESPTSVTTAAAGVEQPTPTFEQQFDATFGTAEERANARGAETSTSQETTGFTSTRSRGNSFNIARFRSEVATSDSVLPTHSFLVVFSPMPWVNASIAGSAVRQDLDSLLTMRCENAILPAINLLQEQNIRRYGFGPVENVAYGVNVGDFTLQFIVDKQALLVDFFEAWLNKIVNRDSFGGANMNNRGEGGRRPYEVAYKDSYACPAVNVFVYDRAQNNVMEYNIYDVFPTGIQSLNMSWGEENTLLKLNITFSFTDLRIRPQFSAFNQSAASVPPRPLDPALRRLLEEGNQPLISQAVVDASTAAALTDLSRQPVVIGEGDNGAARAFGVPEDTAALPSTSPEVPAPTTRNAFGQPEIIA